MQTNWTFILFFGVAMLIFGSIALTSWKNQRKRQEKRNNSDKAVDMPSLFRELGFNVDKFVKTIISSNVTTLMLFLDASLVFGTTLLTQAAYAKVLSEEYVHYSFWIALIMNAIPFTLATFFATRWSEYKSINRFKEQYIDPSSKDYRRNTKFGEGKAWTIALSDLKSLPRRLAEEFIQDKEIRASKELLISTFTAWVVLQSVIIYQITVGVTETFDGAAPMSAYIQPIGVLIFTMVLDGLYVWSTASVFGNVRELAAEYHTLMEEEEDFKDGILVFCQKSGYDVTDLAIKAVTYKETSGSKEVTLETPKSKEESEKETEKETKEETKEESEEESKKESTPPKSFTRRGKKRKTRFGVKK